LAATLRLHPLGFWASASCAVNKISTAITDTRPSAAIRAKITNVDLGSIDIEYLTKYIKMIGNFVFKVTVGMIPVPLFSFLGDSCVYE
jgi:hypothetical protein